MKLGMMYPARSGKPIDLGTRYLASPKRKDKDWMKLGMRYPAHSKKPIDLGMRYPTHPK